MTNTSASLQGLVNDSQAPVEDEPTVRERAIQRSLEELFSTDRMKMKSDLSQKQVTAIARGEVFVEKYGNRAMTTLIENILQLSVSKDRKGREEFVRLVRASQEDARADEARQEGLLKRIFHNR